ncbi:MAG: beta-lactamase family protein [Leptospirales bacterium]|nr:beta-lactamase family protein [Leptospirales bacterium]
MRPRFLMKCVLLCALAQCTTSAAPVDEPPPTHVDQEKVNALSWDLETFLNYHRSQGVFYSMTVGVVRGKDLVYSRYIGSYPSRTYSVGSISKIFTATAVERLAEKGILKLDEPIGEVFPGLHIERSEYKSPRITLRHLLSHSSGMPDLRYYNPPEMIHHPEIDFPIAPQTAPAGIQFRYSNMGFQILGEAIKKKTGKTINQVIQSEVYDAAGMTESTMLDGSTGAYGVMTNVTDMARFASLYLSRGTATNGQRVLKEKSVLSMLENQIYSPPAEFKDYNGIGWRVRMDRQGVVQFYHIGGATGVAAWLQIFPRDNVALFYLGDPPKYEENTMGVLSGIMGKLGFLATAFAGKTEPIFPFKQSTSDESELSHFAGVYRDPVSGQLASVSVNGSTVMVQKGSGPAYPTVPECRAIFNGGYGFVQHSFILDPKNESVVGVATNDSYFEKLSR